MEKIYIISTCTKLEQHEITKFPDLGAEDIVGWYSNKEDAEKVVNDNLGDIWETCYNYAIIEEVQEGLYPCSTTRWIYKYNKDRDGYDQIEEPAFLNGFCGLVVG